MSLKATLIKDAIKNFEEKYQVKASDEAHVKLWGQLPPIEKMDASLQTLTNCSHLSLSTNAIDKISNLAGLHNLKVLSLGRNNIKKLENLDPVANSLEELWISYNNIERLTGIAVLKKLRVLYMSNNKVDKWTEFERLQELANLEELLFTNNPLEEAHSKQGNWRAEVIKRLPRLKKLDGMPITEQERIDAGVSS
eukprot:comp12476_c0_seq1/m.16369 comp12476_c0_seq1/g.16369  ORF comp12476_c0_seq1/g.16369 comp12476_c0_seq1/m.16369 type:complete len:195 (-) comp12476_c0_seq1:13-597(-)